MQRCTFCGSEFPDNTCYCGQCGRAPGATLNAPTTLSSGQARLVPKKEAEEEEERRHRAFLLDLSYSSGGGDQPGVGHVPVVQGAPSSLSSAPAVSAVSSSAAPSAPSHFGPLQAPQSEAPIAPTASSAPPKPMGSPHTPQEPPRQERQVQHPFGKHHVTRSAGSAPARVIWSAHKLLLIGLGVIVASGITLAVVRTHPPAGGTGTQTPARPGTIARFSVPTAGSTHSTITAGPDGNLWFTEYIGNKIGRITPGGATTGFSAPTDPVSDGERRTIFLTPSSKIR